MRFSVLAFVLVGIFCAVALAAEIPAEWKREWPKTDFTKSEILFSEVISGGPPKDGIPAIDVPRFESVRNVTKIGQKEPVIVLVHGAEAKAYPLSILMWHEIANDTIDGLPVTVTYCPLCNAAIVFDRRIGELILDFGVSGKLRHSDMIMYDRQTESWWQQFTGEGIVGEFAGQRLETLPAAIWPFERFSKTYPHGLVLVPNNKHARRYGTNPYRNYDTSSWPFLYRGTFDEKIPALAYVIVVGDQAWPLALIRKQQDLTAYPLELTWHDGMNSALDARNVSEGRNIGFVEIFDISGQKKQPVPFVMTFAFAFRVFHPDGVIHGLPDE